MNLVRSESALEAGESSLELNETLAYSTGLFAAVKIIRHDKDKDVADIKVSPSSTLLYSGKESLTDGRYVMPHEFLHIVGLVDRYWSDIIKAGDERIESPYGVDSGYETDIMGAGAQKLSNPNNFRGLVEMARNAEAEGKTVV